MAGSDGDSLQLNMDSDGETAETTGLTSSGKPPRKSLKAKKKRKHQRQERKMLCGCATVCIILFVVVVMIVIPVLAYNVYRLRFERDTMKTSHDAEIAFMQKELDHAVAPCPRQLCPICPGADGTQISNEGTRVVGTPPTPKPEAKNLLDFSRPAFRQKVESERQLLESYWEDPARGQPANDVLIKMLGIKPGDASYDSGVAFVAEKMARAFVWNDKFVIGAIGSSVAAGHDNCAYDAYEAQLERHLKPIFGEAKVAFQVRNAGQGGGCGDSFRNQIWCVRSMLGDDIDIGHYSWTYFENGDVKAEHESFLRWLLMMPHAPAGWIFNTGGSNASECLSDSHNTPELAAKYGKFGFNSVCLSTGISYHGYPGLKWGAIGDGKHATTRYGESEPEERKNSLGVLFRNWHPGPLGFQVVSDAFAYYYLECMAKALDLLAEVVPEDADAATVACKRAELEARWPKVPALFNLKLMGAPLYCNSKFCNGPEPPGCGNFELPTFGRSPVVPLPLNDNMNPFNTKYDPGKKWTYWKEGNSDLIPREERALPQCMHADHCAGWQAVNGQAAGWITFRLPRMDVGRIVVCLHAKEGKFLIEANTVFMLEEATLHPTAADEVYKKCLEVQKEFSNTMTDAKGHVHLGIYVNSSTTITITHVITY